MCTQLLLDCNVLAVSLGSDHKQVGQRLALQTMLIGLAPALIMAVVTGGIGIAWTAPIQVSVGLGVLFLCATLGGRFTAAHATQPGIWGIGVGAGLAIGSVLLAALAGSSTSLLLHPGGSAFDWVAKPVFAIGFFGYVPAVALGVSYAVRVRRRIGQPAGPPARLVGVVGWVVTALPLLVLGGHGVRDERSYAMRWEAKDGDHVVLTFVDYPNYYQAITSADLLEHLRRRGTENVSVTFRITTDFGRTRGVSLTHIEGWSGTLDGWEGGGNSCGGEFPSCDQPQRSPWQNE